MTELLKGGLVPAGGGFAARDVLLEDGIVVDIAPDLPESMGDSVFFLPGCHLLPGLADVHVHLRQPGFEHKETIATGTAAAAAGGFTAVCAMPNLSPPPDSLENLQVQLDVIEREARVAVRPIGCITAGRAGGEVVDMAALAPFVAGFSDDGDGVQRDEVMRAALLAAAAAGSTVFAHSEDTRFAPEDPRSEYKQLERDLALVEELFGGAAGAGGKWAGRPVYHLCHMSSAESVTLMRAAKARGLPVSCETAPHYLVFCREEIGAPDFDASGGLAQPNTTNPTPQGCRGTERSDAAGVLPAFAAGGGRFKMNPPIRSGADRQALLAAVADGTVDAIATDHAPHAAREKAGGFAASANGIVGLETALPAMVTRLVRSGVIGLERLVELMSAAPRRLAGLGPNSLMVGAPLDAVAVALEESYTVDPERFLSLGRSTPFEGMRLYGRVRATWAAGKLVYDREGLS